MANDDAVALKHALLGTYGSFADKRIKKLEVGDRFIVDGRTRGDIGADGNPLGWFCRMFLQVQSGDTVVLKMNNLPRSHAVEEWLSKRATTFGHDGVEVSVQKGSEHLLGELATLLEAITAPGSRYPVRHYKYAVPRVANALGTLREALARGWSR